MVKSNKLKVNSKPSITDIKEFIDNCQDSLDTFTYFDKRPFEVVKTHLITVLIKNNRQTIGYGHLEKEKNKIWLGILIKGKYKGKGYGRYLMNYLLTQYKNINSTLPLFLTVHVSNGRAISLFEKFGFIRESLINNDLKYMMKYLNR